MAHAVETHPQRKRIIDALLAGQSVRAIAATLDPPMHYTALDRYRREKMQPALRNAAQSAKVLARATSIPANEIPPETAVSLNRAAARALQDAPIVQPYLARIAEHQQTIDAAIGFACDNEDPKAVAALVTTDLKGMEFHARLMGVSLDGPRQAATEVNLTLMLPIPRALPVEAPRQLAPADVEFSDPEE
jgi:hypothetical protein